MITGAIKNKVDKIWLDIFSAGLANPLTVIEQLTYLMFIRSLDAKELENESMESLGIPVEKIFPPTPSGQPAHCEERTRQRAHVARVLHLVQRHDERERSAGGLREEIFPRHEAGFAQAGDDALMPHVGGHAREHVVPHELEAYAVVAAEVEEAVAVGAGAALAHVDNVHLFRVAFHKLEHGLEARQQGSVVSGLFHHGYFRRLG